MRTVSSVVAVAVWLVLPAGIGRSQDHASGEGARVVLTVEGPWRCYVVWRSPVMREAGGELVPLKGQVADAPYATPLPPANWADPGFDDRAWAVAPAASAAPEYGPYYGIGWTRALQYLRARFEVADPTSVEHLSVSLAYRGGVAIYLNGTEIARRHLPAGDLTPDTPADDYPLECFAYPNGRTSSGYRLLPHKGQWDWKTYKAAYDARVRRLENVVVPASALRKGVNVLAVEVHRSPYPAEVLTPRNRTDMQSKTRIWETCGLVDVEVQADGGAVRPNLPGPRGVRIWSESPMRTPGVLSHGDAFGGIGEVQIVGCRKGAFCGQVMVSSDQPLRGVQADVTDLTQPRGGPRIPASSVRLLYAVRDDRMLMVRRSEYWSARGFFDTLVEQPPAEVPVGEAVDGLPGAAVLPIWLKVTVPPHAQPGDYRGTLTIKAGDDELAVVPVRLRVVGFRLPDTTDYMTHLGLIQSPESVAMYYSVPPWSERHWQLLERSFALLGELGNKLVVLPLICKTNYGNAQTLVRWVRKDVARPPSAATDKPTPSQPGAAVPHYDHDFTVLDRYLDLAQKYLKPDVVCLYLWDRHMDQYQMTGHSVPTGETTTRDPAVVTEWDPSTGHSRMMEAPKYGTPEALAFWRPVLMEVRARLEKRGLGEAAMLGMTGDRFWQPTKATVAQLKAILPGLKWIENAHMYTQTVHGEPVGYHTVVYVSPRPPAGNKMYSQHRDHSSGGRYYGWMREEIADIYPRTANVTGGALTPAGNLVQHRMFLEVAQFSGYSGLGRTGADFWPVTGERGRLQSIVGRYPNSSWRQLDMTNATEALLAPGPEGPTSTARFEMIREGLQETEARIFIEKALTDPARRVALGEDLARRAQQTLDRRGWIIYTACRSGGWEPYPVLAPQLTEQLFTTAAEVAGKLSDGRGHHSNGVPVAGALSAASQRPRHSTGRSGDEGQGLGIVCAMGADGGARLGRCGRGAGGAAHR